jgi:hypothetical protein
MSMRASYTGAAHCRGGAGLYRAKVIIDKKVVARE